MQLTTVLKLNTDCCVEFYSPVASDSVALHAEVSHRSGDRHSELVFGLERDVGQDGTSDRHFDF